MDQRRADADTALTRVAVDIFSDGAPRDLEAAGAMCRKVVHFFEILESVVEVLRASGRCHVIDPLKQPPSIVFKDECARRLYHGDMIQYADTPAWWHLMVVQQVSQHLLNHGICPLFSIVGMCSADDFVHLRRGWNATVPAIRKVLTTRLRESRTTVSMIVRRGNGDAQTRWIDQVVEWLNAARVPGCCVKADFGDDWSDVRIRTAMETISECTGEPFPADLRAAFPLNAQQRLHWRDVIFRFVHFAYMRNTQQQRAVILYLPPKRLEIGQPVLLDGSVVLCHAWARDRVELRPLRHCTRCEDCNWPRGHAPPCSSLCTATPDVLEPLQPNAQQRPLVYGWPTVYASMESLRRLMDKADAARLFRELPHADARASAHDPPFSAVCQEVRCLFPDVWAAWREHATRGMAAPSPPPDSEFELDASSSPLAARSVGEDASPAAWSADAFQDAVPLPTSESGAAGTHDALPSSGAFDPDASLAGRFAIHKTVPIRIQSVETGVHASLHFHFINCHGQLRTNGTVAYSSLREKQSFQTNCEHRFFDTCDALVAAFEQLVDEPDMATAIRNAWGAGS